MLDPEVCTILLSVPAKRLKQRRDRVRIVRICRINGGVCRSRRIDDDLSVKERPDMRRYSALA
jgi:hypothetical protein